MSAGWALEGRGGFGYTLQAVGSVCRSIRCTFLSSWIGYRDGSAGRFGFRAAHLIRIVSNVAFAGVMNKNTCRILMLHGRWRRLRS